MRGVSFGLLAVVLACGCGKPPEAAKPAAAEKAHDHTGWWCDEHGVPEAECSLCSPKVFKAAQAKGDVCDKHPDRAKSQCFVCTPALRGEFAKRYAAKVGKEPPEPTGQYDKK